MDASQESKSEIKSRYPTRFPVPISIGELAGIIILLVSDVRFLATLRTPHNAWYLLNVFLYLIWLVVALAALKYRWPASLSDCSITPFRTKADGAAAWLGWHYLIITCVGALFIHPAITGVLVTFRWRDGEYLKARQANFLALLIIAGYALYALKAFTLAF